MAGKAHDTGAGLAYDAITGRATVNSRTTYLMLVQNTHTITDTSTGANVEGAEIQTAGTGGYARQSVTWSAPTAGAGSNSGTITFGPASADWANATQAALVDLVSGTPTNIYAYWTLDVPKDAASGDSITIANGALTFTVD